VRLIVWLNEDLFWRIDPPLADEVWSRLELEKPTMVMAKEFAEAVAASSSPTPKALRPLLDEINGELEAGDTSMMVIVEKVAERSGAAGRKAALKASGK
jgi:hypothetical protein